MFKKIKKEVEKEVVINPLEGLWAEYWSVKEEIKSLQAKQERLEKEIIVECEKQNLFEGQTATYGVNKVSYTDRPKLIVPKGFDLRAFAEKNPDWVRVDLDSAKICKFMLECGDGVVRFGEFEIEVKRFYNFKR
ncbi:MAG: hypothetical protein NZ551_07535 [Microscillaceae bacterium]|nr:hypothetical protein [Microscillaceae bacterium]MDW8461047.1 hypothetical protein [Cytophagales bacterium]